MMWVMDDWIEVGPHHYHLEGDILYWRPSGEVLPAHVDHVCMLFRRIADEYGYALWLVDASRSVPVGFESRRRYAYWLSSWQGVLICASFHAPLAARTMASLTSRAVNLSSSTEIRLENFDSELAARTYLREQAAAQRRHQSALREAGSLL